MEQSKHHSLMSLFLFVIAYQKPFANRSLIFVEDAKINQFFFFFFFLDSQLTNYPFLCNQRRMDCQVCKSDKLNVIGESYRATSLKSNSPLNGKFN